MTIEHPGYHHVPPSPLRAGPRRPTAFYALMLASMAALCLGVYASHRAQSLFASSVEENQRWEACIQRLRALRDLAGEVNAPSNDIFESHDAEHEAAVMQDALARYRASAAALRSGFASSRYGLHLRKGRNGAGRDHSHTPHGRQRSRTGDSHPVGR